MRLSKVSNNRKLHGLLNCLKRSISMTINRRMKIVRTIMHLNLNLSTHHSTLTINLLNHALKLTLRTHDFNLNLHSNLSTLNILLNKVRLNIKLILTLSANNFNLLHTLMRINFNYLLDYVTINFNLLLRNHIRLTLPRIHLTLNGLSLLNLHNGLNLLLNSMRLTLLLNHRNNLRRVNLNLYLINLLLWINLLRIRLILTSNSLLNHLSLHRLNLLLSLNYLINTRKTSSTLKIKRILSIRNTRLRTRINRIILKTIRSLNIRTLTITRRLLRIRLTSGLSRLTRRRFNSLTHRFRFVRVRMILKNNLSRLKNLTSLRIHRNTNISRSHILHKSVVLNDRLRLRNARQGNISTLRRQSGRNALTKSKTRLTDA